MKRREFITNSCKACMAIAFAGSATTMLEGCGAGLPIYKTTVVKDTILVPAAQLVLAKPYLLVRENSLEFDILILSRHDNFQTVYLQCTHGNNPLIVSDKKLSCPAHGSQFDFEGNILKGPADKPLKSFKTHYSDKGLEIRLV